MQLRPDPRRRLVPPHLEHPSTLDPAPEPSSDKGAREGRVDEVDRNCRIVIDGPKNDTGKDGKSAFPAVAFPARTAVLGVEQLGRSDWSLPCVQFLPVPLPCCSRAAPWLSPPIRRSWPRLRLTCWATRIAAAVADERVEHAGTAIHDLIVVAARDSAEAAAAELRFVEIFSAIAAPSQDRDGFPSCKIVIARFERLQGYQQQAGY